MKIVTFNAPIIISHLSKHDEIKPQIIHEIGSLGRFSFTTKDLSQRITHTDWHINGRYKQTYLEILAPHIESHIEDVKNVFGFRNHKLKASWFQWYESGDYHARHAHQECMFSSVYYVSLDKQSPATGFVLNNQEFYIDVEEGDVITFPSFISHHSKPNESSVPKVVIAFNSDFS